MRFVKQVGLGQEAALGRDGVGLGFQVCARAEGLAVPEKIAELAPNRLAFGVVFGGLLPKLAQAGQLINAGVNLQQLSVARLRLDGFDGRQRWISRRGSDSAGTDS